MTDRLLLEFESIPGEKDKSGKGVRSYMWRLLTQRREAYLEAVSQLAACDRSLQRHKTHCSSHPKDAQAAKRNKRLERRSLKLQETVDIRRAKMRLEEKNYKRKMIELARIPLLLNDDDAEVDIVDEEGSVRIRFVYYPKCNVWMGVWILTSKGEVIPVLSPPVTT